MGTVAEMLRRMSSKELTDWLAFASLEPIGDLRGDVQAATVSSAVVAAAGVKVKLKDWLPDYDKEKEQETPEQTNKRFRMILGLKLKND